MKAISTLLIFLLAAGAVLAQKDTTKLKFGKKNVIIINKNEDARQKLEEGRMDFKMEVLELQESLEAMKQELETEDDDAKRAKLEKKIAETEKQIAALESGIADIESEIEKLSSDIEAEVETEIEESFDFDDYNPFKKPSERNKFDGHIAGFGIGFCNFVDANQEFELPENGDYLELNETRSWTFMLNFMEFNIPVVKKYVGFTTGMGIEWNSYFLKRDVSLAFDSDNDLVVPTESEIDFKRNKLNTGYLQVPLILEFQIPVTKKNKRIYFAGGVVGGIRIASSHKQVWEVNDNKYKTKIKEDFDLSPFKYGLTFRAGFDFVNFFVNYSLSPLFENSDNPELFPVSAGIILLDF